MAFSNVFLLLVLSLSVTTVTRGQGFVGEPGFGNGTLPDIENQGTLHGNGTGGAVGADTGSGTHTGGQSVGIGVGNGPVNNNDDINNDNLGADSTAGKNGTGSAGNDQSVIGSPSTGTGNKTGTDTDTGVIPNVDGTGTGGAATPINGTGTGGGIIPVNKTETGSGSTTGNGTVIGIGTVTGQSNGTDSIGNNISDTNKFLDSTSFSEGFNGWSLKGYFAMLELTDDSQPIPRPPNTNDSTVLICLTDKMPCVLSKELPALENATLYITHFIHRGPNFYMECSVTTQNGEKVTIIPRDARDIGDMDEEWILEEFGIPSVVATQPFRLEFVLQGQDQEWGVKSIRVKGWKSTNLPDITTPSPSTNTSSPIVVNPDKNTTTNTTIDGSNNTTGASNNATKAPGVIINPSNVTDSPNVTNVNTTDANTTEGSDNMTGNQSGISDNTSMSSHISELSRVAKAIWDAFYVFLALFCVCLVALIVLIYRSRNRSENQTPAVAAYHPRNNSYRLDKLYDNPSFEQQQPAPQA